MVMVNSPMFDKVGIESSSSHPAFQGRQHASCPYLRFHPVPFLALLLGETASALEGAEGEPGVLSLFKERVGVVSRWLTGTV